MLTLTPHIIRTPDITEADLLPIWVGTETEHHASAAAARGSSRRPRDRSTPARRRRHEPAAAQERLRQQLEQLPPGLQQPEPSEEAEPEGQPPGGEDRRQPETPRGFELVPRAELPRRPSLSPPPPAEEPDDQSASDEPAARIADSDRLADSVAAAFDPAEPTRRRRPLRGGGSARRGGRRATRARAVAAGGGGRGSLRGRARGDGGDRGVAPAEHAGVRPRSCSSWWTPRRGAFLGEGAEAADARSTARGSAGGGGRQPAGPHPRRRRTRHAAACSRFRALRPGDGEIRFEKQARARRVPAGGGTAGDHAGEAHHRPRRRRRRRSGAARARRSSRVDREAPRSEEP